MMYVLFLSIIVPRVFLVCAAATCVTNGTLACTALDCTRAICMGTLWLKYWFTLGLQPLRSQKDSC